MAGNKVKQLFAVVCDSLAVYLVGANSHLLGVIFVLFLLHLRLEKSGRNAQVDFIAT